MSSFFSSREADLGVTDDSISAPFICPLDDRTPKQNRALSAESAKTSKSGEIEETTQPAPKSPQGDENQCPNIEETSRKTEETRFSSCQNNSLDSTQQDSTASCKCADENSAPENRSAIEDSGAANVSVVMDSFNDVSMMSVDGNLSVDLGSESVAKLRSETELSGSNTTASRQSDQSENSQIDAKATRKSSSVSTDESILKTPTNLGTVAPNLTSFCEDDLFLTPSQDLSGSDCGNSTRSLPSSPSEGKKSQLDGTFDKAESEVSLIEPKKQGTFDKEPSFLRPGVEVAGISRVVTPDFDLRLDSTNHPDEQTANGTKIIDTMSTPNKRNSSGIFTYRGVSEKEANESSTKASRKVTITPEYDKSNTEQDPEKKEKRSSSFLKRRCSLLELSFVSSPKRANFQLKTPKTADKNNHSSLINFNESIAFDFTAAAKSAEINGGVAEMGSFVFSATSGLPVCNFAEAFSKSPQGEEISPLASKDEKFTRVSFIAMFDPIKVPDGSPETSESDKRKTPVHKMIRKCSTVASQQTSASSPLIKGLPTPAFAKPNPLSVVLKSVDVQTETIAESEKAAESEPTHAPEEIADEVAKLNKIIQDQSTALLTYEEVVRKIVESRRKKQENPSKDSKLKIRLDEERVRNEQLEDAVRSMERSMHSTLMRMQEFRTANEELRKVVEEQQNALIDTRTELDDCQIHWQQEVAIRDEDRQRLTAHWEETSLAHEKAVSMLKLQLQAKESEIESLTMQNTIARKEVDSLRTLVSSMKLQ